ncbi:MAG: hypothetical protein E5W93_17860 [Mesorhizobium sp.]|nr:MAG: hypothetical protein E5W93_17860 [Mesorhizobium sp.]
MSVAEQMEASTQASSNAVPPGGLAAVSRILLLFCLCYIAGAMLLWPTIFLAMAKAYLSTLVVTGWIVALAIAIPAGVMASPQQPLHGVIGFLRSRGRQAALVIGIFVLGLSAFTTYKLNIPNVVPFYGDRAMADIDEFLHGTAPWRIAHSIDTATLSWLVEKTYSQLWFLEWFALAFLAAFHVKQPVHLRYLVALALTTVVIGTILATLLSSVGPIFYDRFVGGSRFTDLHEALRLYPYSQHMTLFSDYLLKSYTERTADFGTGISAMPSMHVAVATLNAFYVTRLNRGFGAAAWAFAALILFGSVYTGWHYAIDGYVSIALVAMIWRWSARISGNTARRAETHSGDAL